MGSGPFSAPSAQVNKERFFVASLGGVITCVVIGPRHLHLPRWDPCGATLALLAALAAVSVTLHRLYKSEDESDASPLTWTQGQAFGVSPDFPPRLLSESIMRGEET